jgi:hypothetical protein
MSEYRHEDGIAHVSLDDGKVNALGTVALADVNAHLDHAIRDDAAAVIISGRDGVFSAGFDLKELRSGDAARESLRRQLIDLELRIFSFERPVIVACSGHALAAGAALLLATDRRIGLDGPFNLISASPRPNWECLSRPPPWSSLVTECRCHGSNRWFPETPSHRTKRNAPACLMKSSGMAIDSPSCLEPWQSS